MLYSIMSFSFCECHISIEHFIEKNSKLRIEHLVACCEKTCKPQVEKLTYGTGEYFKKCNTPVPEGDNQAERLVVSVNPISCHTPIS